MNESETRAEYIDPKLKKAGWCEVEGSKILREFHITDGRIQVGGKRSKPEIAAERTMKAIGAVFWNIFRPLFSLG